MLEAISSFEVSNGFKELVKTGFNNWPEWIENYKGFIRLDVLSPIKACK